MLYYRAGVETQAALEDGLESDASDLRRAESDVELLQTQLNRLQRQLRETETKLQVKAVRGGWAGGRVGSRVGG